MDCAPYFSSPKAPIFVTGTKLSIAIQSLEACYNLKTGHFPRKYHKIEIYFYIKRPIFYLVNVWIKQKVMLWPNS